MNSQEIRQKFLDFFKARGHAIVPSSSLIPDDPSVLLTTAGMQQFKRYYTGELDPMKDFGSKNTVSIQKAFRTSDIDEVGDETHLTFFEMLGHFSFGDYFKKETIGLTYELLTEVFQIPAGRISATVFEGDELIPFDQESFEAWSKLLPSAQIRKGPRADNVWGPAGTEGPCGACNEVYVDDVEVATLVFMEYYSRPDKSLEKLMQKGVDVGWGFERLVAKLQDKRNIFETDLFVSLIDKFPSDQIRVKRILADHVRAAVHLIADGLEPSNKDRGYTLRRLLRRAAFHALDLSGEWAKIPLGSAPPKSWNERSSIKEIAETAIDLSYFEIKDKKELILSVIDREVGGFFDLIKSRSEIHDLTERYLKENKEVIAGGDAFKLSSTFGIPIDYIKDEASKVGLRVDVGAFEIARKKHQEISRAGQEKKFGGHGLLLDTGELKAGSEEELNKVLRLHTVTHLLQQALREVLGSEVHQMGSDITAERTRFDFSFLRRMTSEEIKKVERLVNQKIAEDLPVDFVELPKNEAEGIGALHFFKGKYPDRVKVYFVGHDLKSAWSKEFCGGPHVARTGEIGKFKITKEEAVSAGVRRIRGVVE